MSNLYLIAHKVRGEPAFDIAERCDDMGTPTDPGPWWIIPTSGHRAYPYWYHKLVHGEWPPQVNDYPDIPMPENIPDHYAINDRKPESKPGKITEIDLAELGL